MNCTEVSREETNLINILRKRKTGPLESYISNAMINCQKTILLGKALAELLNEELENIKSGKILNKKFVYYLKTILNRIRAKIRVANTENILSFAVHYCDYLQEGNVSLSNLFFGCDECEFEESKNIFNLIVLCHHENKTLFKDLDDLTDKRSKTLLLIADFIVTMPYSHIFENLIYLIINGDVEAKTIFKKFILIYLSIRSFPEIVPYTQWKDIVKNISRKRIFTYVKNAGLLPVPDNYVEYVDQLLQEIANIHVDAIHIVDFIDWFKKNIDDFNIMHQLMWEEITNSPKYWVRSNGLDCVKIDFDKINSNALEILKLQFISEGLQFPKVWARFWCKLQGEIHIGEYLLEITSLKDFNLSQTLSVDDPEIICDQIYLFIATHCLWKIVTGGEFKQKNKETAKKSKNNGDNISPKSATEVRPHFRKLPIGRIASEGAKNYSIELWGTEPPSGKTFVKKHIRNLQSEFEELDKVPPIFSYSNNDFVANI